MSFFGISSRNLEQKEALRALANKKPFVFLTGQAGTGKTLLAEAVGLEHVVEERRYRKLIYTRLQVPLGREVGHLPGDIQEKSALYMQPFVDNLEVMTESPNNIMKYLASGDDGEKAKNQKIFFEPIQTMRGRSLNHSYIIIDEAQNLDLLTISALATRIGIDSKMVFIGNFSQTDIASLRDPSKNGLYKLLFGLYNEGAYDLFDHINLQETHRNRAIDVVEKILRNNAMAPEMEALEHRGDVDNW